MSSAKVETWLKKLRLIFYDKAQVVDQSASPPKGATEPAAAAASPAPRPKTGDDNEALNAINKAMRSINASSETWSEIAKAADGLLTYERAEEVQCRPYLSSLPDGPSHTMRLLWSCSDFAPVMQWIALVTQ